MHSIVQGRQPRTPKSDCLIKKIKTPSVVHNAERAMTINCQPKTERHEGRVVILKISSS